MTKVAILGIGTVGSGTADIFEDNAESIRRNVGEDVQVSRNVRFINWSDHFEEAGLDPAVHLYDGGHLNQAGAKVFFNP